jgi:hypothetical protein
MMMLMNCSTKKVLEKIGYIFIEGQIVLVNDENRITTSLYYGQVD